MNKERLEGIEGKEFARTELIQIIVDEVNWRILYRNPRTGEYWKESFPQSEMHGGGSPMLEKITEEEAKQEFGFRLK